MSDMPIATVSHASGMARLRKGNEPKPRSTAALDKSVPMGQARAMPIVPSPAAPRRRPGPLPRYHALHILLALAATIAPAASAKTPDTRAASGIVRYVTDGDTFRLTSGERIRIAGIDAPETQAQRARCPAERRRGEAAKAHLKSMIEGKSLRFTRVGRSYDRTVATVRHGGRDLAARLVDAGDAAWWPRGKAKPDWCRPD